MRYLVILLLAAACRPASDGLTSVALSEGRSHSIALAECRGGQDVIGLADAALALIVYEAGRQGLGREAEIRQAVLGGGPVWLCVIDAPGPCCLGGWPCAGPCRQEGTAMRCARKAGCAQEQHVWVARSWPPICDPLWPDEPHCIATADPSYDYRQTLVHELGNVVRLRALPAEGYTDSSSSRLYAPGGPVDRAIRVLTER